MSTRLIRPRSTGRAKSEETTLRRQHWGRSCAVQHTQHPTQIFWCNVLRGSHASKDGQNRCGLSRIISGTRWKPRIGRASLGGKCHRGMQESKTGKSWVLAGLIISHRGWRTLFLPWRAMLHQLHHTFSLNQSRVWESYLQRIRFKAEGPCSRPNLNLKQLPIHVPLAARVAVALAPDQVAVIPWCQIRNFLESKKKGKSFTTAAEQVSLQHGQRYGTTAHNT